MPDIRSVPHFGSPPTCMHTDTAVRNNRVWRASHLHLPEPPLQLLMQIFEDAYNPGVLLEFESWASITTVKWIDARVRRPMS
eukprot:366030-Chlamydomonas_euryale.AAC.5